MCSFFKKNPIILETNVASGKIAWQAFKKRLHCQVSTYNKKNIFITSYSMCQWKWENTMYIFLY